MAILHFLAGGVCTVALAILLLPWLRTIPRLQLLPQLPWPAGAVALVVLCLTAGAYAGFAPQGRFGETPAVNRTAPPEAATAAPSQSNDWADVAGALQTAGSAAAGSGGGKAPARSMNDAVSSLEARLAQGGGSAADWELLAKSYEFMGRTADADRARQHQLPSAAPATGAAVGDPGINGEVSLTAALRGKAPSGTTLFVIAKSVDSPGMPVAVMRTAVSDWPLKFHLDDTESMVPGRTLSTAGRVVVEARISRSGQPLASSGDLQGSSGPVDPATHPTLTIAIDRVLP